MWAVDEGLQAGLSAAVCVDVYEDLRSESPFEDSTVGSVQLQVTGDMCMPSWTAVCANHKEPWEFFCKEHKACLCRSCLEEHKSHPFQLLEEAKAVSMDRLQGTIRTLEDSQKQMQSNVEWLQCASSQVTSDRANLREQLTQLFDKIQDTLAAEKEAILALVDDEKEKSLKRLESHLREEEEKNRELARLITEAKELVVKEISSKDFMDLYNWVMERMLKVDVNFPQCLVERHELDWTVVCQIKRDSQAAVRNIGKVINDTLLRKGKSKFLEPIRVTAPKPISLVSSFTPAPPVPPKPVKSAITLQPSTPETSEFFLDPNTAHCNIIISDDRLSAQWVAHTLTRPPHPERFRLHPQVLCSQGLSTGEHTWQVEVGGNRRWEVGVTCKSRDQSWVDSCISWALRWDGRQLQAFEGNKRYYNPKLVAIKQAPELLRLHLNCGQKVLSFFTSKDNLLHSFTIKPSGPVFPGFYLEESAVKIKKLENINQQILPGM